MIMPRQQQYLLNKSKLIYNKSILMEKNSKSNGNQFFHYKKKYPHYNKRLKV